MTQLKRTFAAAIAAVVVGTQIPAGALADGPVGEVVGGVSSTTIGPTLSFVASSASTATTAANQKQQAYLAAAGQAANFVQTAGEAAVSPLLREVMQTEKMIVAQARGPKTAAQLNDIHLAQMVVFRAEEFKQQ